jgi:hypothetical protein
MDIERRPDPFPDQATGSLSDLLVSNRTRLSPAGDDEQEHEDHPIASRGHLPSCWAHGR